MQVGRNAVVDRRNKIGVRQWFALVVGDGNQWHFAEAGIKGLEICQILPAVKRSQSPSCQRAEKREVEEIDVKMKNVKLLRALAHLIDHQHEVRNDVAHGRIEAQRASTTGSQLGAGDESPRLQRASHRDALQREEREAAEAQKLPMVPVTRAARQACPKLGVRLNHSMQHKRDLFPQEITRALRRAARNSPARSSGSSSSPRRQNSMPSASWMLLAARSPSSALIASLRRLAMVRASLVFSGYVCARAPIACRPNLPRLTNGQRAGIVFNTHFEGDGAIIYKHACQLGCEGMCRNGSARHTGPVACGAR